MAAKRTTQKQDATGEGEASAASRRRTKKANAEPRPLLGQAELTKWVEEIPDDEWLVYKQVIDAAQARGIHFAMGGAFAVATYTGRWRNTKDLDFYVRAEDREAMIEVVNGTGMTDYYDTLAYDRSWIYRAHKEQVIVDVIWAMANHRTQVDDAWLTRGPEIEARGYTLRVVAPEEMIWGKLYIMQRERCDWPDVLNMIYGVGPTLDWNHLLDRLGPDDVRLLAGALSVFVWLAPAYAQQFPASLWRRLHIPPPPREGEVVDRMRVNFIDSRPWFVPAIDPE